MNLGSLRQEVLDHGFDPTQYGTRIDQFINDAQNLIARRVDYFIDEATAYTQTVPGANTYPWPANFARMRSLDDTDRRIELQYVSVRDIDRSGLSNGAPNFYALTGQNIELYPTPDAVYNLQMRYWMMPSVLALDADVPVMPVDWHHLLWVYAVWLCYEGDDDAQMGQYWQQRFNTELSQFSADVKFPDSDGPNQASSMWDSDKSLNPRGGSWSLYGQGW